jgi:branched-chain amino acid transport system substrate-binding protein
MAWPCRAFFGFRCFFYPPFLTVQETPMKKRFALKFIAVAAFAVSAGASFGQNVIKIANIVELSGGGATAGTNFKNGVELAVKEINAAGGVLGQKIQTITSDTQTNPGVAKGLTQKAVDDDVFAVFGPVYSGSIMVSMAESRRAEVPNFTGGEAASITARATPMCFAPALASPPAFPSWPSTSAPSTKPWPSFT